jgi:hypothetical protein
MGRRTHSWRVVETEYPGEQAHDPEVSEAHATLASERTNLVNVRAQSRGRLWACDFVQTYDLFFREVFLFFIIEHGSRQVVHVNVTRSPSDAWVAQQIREATPFGEGARFLICDNDGKYGPLFDHAVDGAGITLIHTPPYGAGAGT